jgi:hypothetical protein
MKFLKPVCSIFLFTMLAGIVYAQKNARTVPERCGTMQNLELLFQKNPQLKQKFEDERSRFNKAVAAGTYRIAAKQNNPNNINGNRNYITIPIVFHVVVTDQSTVTDAQIQAQLDTLNEDYAGINGDAVKVPSYFQSVFGQSAIQFCMAKQTPSGDPTNGIERTTTAQSAFLNTDNAVKHTASGGADIWDPTSYLNVWICGLGGGLLGYGTFPQTGNDNEQGVVIEYRSIPGETDPNYSIFNGGKTLTHEIGHYFNLYHIWGDDNGACTGTDFIDDTPNQGNSSSTCPNGIKLDNCTTSGNGIMYENYMDYTDDECLVMFTVEQVARMESALVAYRSSLINSIGCTAPVTYNLDAQLKSVNQPTQRVCVNPFSPVITIRNRGSQTLTSLTITSVLDNTTVSNSSWNGTLIAQATTAVTLNPVTTTAGSHTLKIYLSNPNNAADQNTVNDSLTINFQYNDPVSSVSESFEGNTFPPTGWDILNPDNSITWQKVTGIAKTGNASVKIDNFEYSAVGQQDYLRLPDLSLAAVDSAFFSFQVAAATYTDIATTNNVWDTLEVLVSTDCGNSYTSLYKKWGASLVTHKTADTSGFAPTASEWRKDSINISNYIGTGKILLAFKNTTGFENNIYLDDINVRTVTINPNLKSKGFLVTPNPTPGAVIVQFYPQPTNIKGIAIFNMSGQKVAEAIPNGQSNYYALDISRYSAGMYVVRVIMGDEVLVKKIIKY